LTNVPVVGATVIVTSDFAYAGYYNHAPSGLYTTLFRFYSSDLGRWISRDPLGEAGGINLYGYVGNNPISRFDPLGLTWYNPASWDWSQIGGAFSGKFGIGLGVSVKPKLGPLKCKLGADYTWTANANSDDGLGESINASAGGSIDIGRFKFGLEKQYEAGFNDNGAVENSETVFGLESDPLKAGSNAKVGLDVTAGVIRAGVEVDLSKVWGGITK